MQFSILPLNRGYSQQILSPTDWAAYVSEAKYHKNQLCILTVE